MFLRDPDRTCVAHSYETLEDLDDGVAASVGCVLLWSKMCPYLPQEALMFLAVCCSALQFVAECCSVSQCVAVCCIVLHCVAL